MQIDELLQAKKISRFDYLAYAIFACTEHGREFFNKMLMDTFMEEPQGMDAGGIELAFIDGRRSLFRDIQRALMTIQTKMKEINNDYGSAESRPT